MSKRGIEIAAFLAGSIWENWEKSQIAGDASARRYLRLTSGGKSVILMDAPPETGERTERFAQISVHLRNAGFSSPAVLKHSPISGLLLLEDLGRTDFARQIENHSDDTMTLYSAAADVLIALDTAQPPTGLTSMSPDVAIDMIDVTGEWYLINGDLTEVKHNLHDCLTRFAGNPDRLALRDFHVENLIWRPLETGLSRVGILDFQDAFLAPAGYDLASLLRDARRIVDPETSAYVISRFVAATGREDQQFHTAFHCLAVQRNLRILGIFARLAIRDRKHKYIAFVQHVWSMIMTDLQDPKLSDLRRACEIALPPPSASRLKGLL